VIKITRHWLINSLNYTLDYSSVTNGVQIMKRAWRSKRCIRLYRDEKLRVIINPAGKRLSVRVMVQW